MRLECRLQTVSRSERRAQNLFDPADLPAKPGRKAIPEEREEYERAKKHNNICLKTIKQLQELRKRYDWAGTADRQILAALDGGFCSRTMFRTGLKRIYLAACCRKDASLCLQDEDPDHPRKIYSDKKFTPEQVRKDNSIPYQTEMIYFGGRNREIRYKEINYVLWQCGAKQKRLRLLVISPTPYKLSFGMQRYYRQPAYLLVTDNGTSTREILQCYFDRFARFAVKKSCPLLPSASPRISGVSCGIILCVLPFLRL